MVLLRNGPGSVSGDELEHLRDIGGAERDRLGAIGPGDALLDHLHQIEGLNRLPALRWLGVAAPDGDVGARCDETGCVLPVLCRGR